MNKNVKELDSIIVIFTDPIIINRQDSLLFKKYNIVVNYLNTCGKNT
jgi:hypothetical protein